MNYKYLLIIFIYVGLLTSCEDEVIEMPQEVPVRGEINRECMSYKTSDTELSSVNLVEEFNDYLVVGGTDDIKVFDKNSMVLIDAYSKNQLQVRNFEEAEGVLYICAIGGMFTIDLQGNILQASDFACGNMNYINNQLLYVSSVGSLSQSERAASQLKILDTGTFQTSFYTDSTYVSTNQFPRQIIHFNQQIFLLSSLDNEISILKLDGSALAEVIDRNNDPDLNSMNIWAPPSNTEMFVWRNKMWLFTYNGSSKYLFRYNGEGFDLESSWNISNTSSESNERILSTSIVNSIDTIGDNLAISSSKGLLLLNENMEITVLTDPLLPSNNWAHFINEQEEIIYVLTNHRWLTEIVCR